MDRAAPAAERPRGEPPRPASATAAAPPAGSAAAADPSLRAKKGRLLKLPADLQYDERRILPVVDEDTRRLIEHAEVDTPL